MSTTEIISAAPPESALPIDDNEFPIGPTDIELDAEVAEAPMKAQRRIGLALSWPRVTSAFLTDVAVLALASHLPGMPHTVAWWVSVGVAAVATIAVVVTYRGITGVSALARWVWDWSAPDIWDSPPEPTATLSASDSSHDPDAILSRGCTPAIDHGRRFGRDVVGIRAYRGQLVAMIAVDGLADQAVSSGNLPVLAVAEGLRQFDVHFDAIDIVSVRKRHVSKAADPSAPQAVDEGPARDERGTWLVLRMDPQHNVGAVAARDSVASTLAAAVERLAHGLNGRHCAARPLTCDEFAEVDTAVAAGLQSMSIRVGWRHLKYFHGCATSFWVSPQDITSQTLDRLWLRDADATVMTIRLTSTAGRPEMSAWVRYHSEKRLNKDACAGLNPLIARQLAAVHASLPAPTRHPPLVVPGRALREHEQLEVRVGPVEVGGGIATLDEPDRTGMNDPQAGSGPEFPNRRESLAAQWLSYLRSRAPRVGLRGGG